MARLETGIIQEGDDWPGLFIRGDRALVAFSPALKALIDGKAGPMEMALCQSLLRLLNSTDVKICENAVQRVTFDQSK